MITLSSCEAEFVALCSIILEVRYLRMLLEELGNSQKESTFVWEDNQAAIVIAEAESSGAGRAKHIDVRFKKVVESVRDGTVHVRHVPTDWNYAFMVVVPLHVTSGCADVLLWRSLLCLPGTASPHALTPSRV